MTRTSVSLVFFLAVLTLFAPAACASTDSLTFFNNWFVTGDYAVSGVGLRGTGVGGWATGKINMTGVPSGAQPIAAFLYWSTSEPTSTPSASIGYFNTNKIQGAVMGNAASPNPGCASSGGGTSGYGFVYRADVLRYLPVDSNNVPQATGNQTVKLADAGSGPGILTNGASLVVIYKIVVPGLPTVAPLRAVVIYNGAYTVNKQSAGLTQNVAGFYQASANDAARMTAIAANGQKGFISPLSINGNTVDSDPFAGTQGGRWDNPSYAVNLATNASSFSVMATAGNSQTCVTFAAIVASTNVQDSDNDGLLDIWETQGLHRNTGVFPATFGTCAQYPSDPTNTCVNLPKMGANPNKKDIFIQIDWMHGSGDGSGGTDTKGAHDHIPQLAALSSVATVFANNGISVHFDVGANYQGNQSTCGNAPCSFIVPATYLSSGVNVPLALGGSDIDENTLVCQSTTKHACDYNEPYPVLSFEFGFASVKDGNSLLGIPGHFPQSRKDAFHYSLFAHALAGPFDTNGHPVDPFTGQPTTTPKSYSGIAHRPGGGFMVTLGLWRSDIPAYDQVGSPQVQAGTLMHELGHNLGLGHAGTSTKPNCMPNYPSVMNYLYQTRGLTDASGTEHVDYSNGVLLPLSENVLSTSIPMAALPGLQRYRVRYYGPLAPNQPSTQAAQLHCDGTPLNGSPFEVRLEGPAVSTPDWSNGTVPLGKFSPPLDVNYDGTTGQLFVDQPDWLTINLQQIGTGYSFGGLSVGAFATDGGAYATDGGAFATDAGALATDGGAFATDGGAFATDGGAFATDGGAFATDGGAFATDGGAFATDAGEIDQDTVLLSSVDPPTGLAATNIGTGITLTWTPPSVGQIQNYNIYRCGVIAPATSCTPVAPVFNSSVKGYSLGGPLMPNFTDTVNDYTDSGKGGSANCNNASTTCYNTTYYYLVTSVVSIGGKITESGNSNTVNTEVPHLFVIANSAGSIVYGTANPVPAYTVYGDVAGSLSNGSVSCGFGAPGNLVTPRNVGTYQISCTGPATTSPNNGVTYNATYLGNTSGTLTITQRPLTVTAGATNKVYDGTPNSTATPAITGTLAYTDTPGFTESYDNRNAGSAHVMTATGIVNDLNSGLNYAVTFVKSAATSVITQLPITVTPAASVKTYDGATNPAQGVIPTIAPNLGVGDTATFTEAYVSKNAGMSLPMVIVTGGTVLDGNSGNNYIITLAPANFGTINKLPITVTPVASAKTYDGTTTPQPGLTPAVAPSVAPGDTANFTEAYQSKNAGNNLTMTTTGTVSDGNNGNNYAITFASSGVGTISKLAITVTAATSTKAYDGTTSSMAVPTITTGSLATGDTVTWTETYDNQNAGSAHVMTPVGTVNDGNGGNNYYVTTITINTGVITQAPASVTPNASGKVYGTADPVLTGTLAGFLLADNVTATYTRTSGETVAGSPYTITATLASTGLLTNYNITYRTANFTITPAPLMITLTNLTQPYSGTPLSPTVTTSPAGISVTLSGAPDTAVGSYQVTATAADPNYMGSANGTFIIADLSSFNLIGGVASFLNPGIRLTQDQGSETSSAWFPAEIPVAAGFSTTFQFQITPSSGEADGFAFVIQANPNGTQVLGTPGKGGYIGYTGILNSIAIEFDTYYNSDYGDPESPHIGIQGSILHGQNSSNHNTNALAAAVPANFADGGPHTATITYDGTTLKVYLDSGTTPIVSANVNLATTISLDGGTNAYVGFTAATGASAEYSDILSWTWTPGPPQ